MTRQRSFKRIVRARMDKTGESYSAARAALMQGRADARPEVQLVSPDEKIRERTGRGWEEWFDLLDEWGAAERPHREISRHVASVLELDPLAWPVQAVTTSYERARGLREAGQLADGSYEAGASRTVAVPVEVLYDAFVDAERRAAWLPDAPLSERTATRPRTARFDWNGGVTRVQVAFTAKGPERALATIRHQGLSGNDEAERMKAYWRERVTALKEVLER